MTPNELKDGKERVLEVLLVPLDKVQRMSRPRGVTEAQHLAGLGEIQARLAHLTREELALVRETVIEALRPQGAKVAWPAPAVVIALGLRLRLPDGGETERVRNVLAWFAARPIVAREDLPWLYLWLRRNAAIPTPYDLKQLAETADAERRALVRIEREMADGLRPTSGDQDLRERVGHARGRVAELVGDVQLEGAV